MIPFIILLLVPIIIQHLGIKGIDYHKKNKIAFLFFFVFLTVLIMLRHETVGTDTSSYMHIFETYAAADWSQFRRIEYEVGYAYFNKIVSLFSSDPQVFLAVAAILVSAMMFPTYRRLCSDTSLTIVLFSCMSTFVMMFSGIRQMMAIAIGCLAYELTRQKKFIAFLLTVAAAVSFHSSAFVLLFIYPLYHVEIKKRHMLVVLPAMLIMFLYNKQVFGALTDILERYTRFEGVEMATGAYMMLVLFIVFAIFSYLIPDENVMDEETLGLRNLLLFSVAIQCFAPLHTLAMRMNYYYIIFIPLLLPKIVEKRRRRWAQVAVFGRHVMVVFFLAYFYYYMSGGASLNTYPYHFFWENVL